LRAASVRSVAAILFQVPYNGGGGGVVGAGDVSNRSDVERVGAAQGGYLVESDAAEAENGVAGAVGLGDSDAPISQ